VDSFVEKRCFCLCTISVRVSRASGVSRVSFGNKSSAVAEMGDSGHSRHGPKRGGLLCPFRGSWDPV